MFCLRVLIIGLTAFPVFTAEGSKTLVRLDLNACVVRAYEASIAVRVSEVDLKIAGAQLDQARAVRFLPKFDLTWVVGPSPEARGNAMDADTDLLSLSLFARMEATLLQPLYTFGKLEATRDMAESGVKARKAGLLKSRTDLELNVVEAYNGLLLADELLRLAEEADEEILKARKIVDQNLEEEIEGFTYSDLFRLDRFIYDVKENLHRVRKERVLVISFLRMLLGLAETDSLVLTEKYLRPLEVKILPLEDYIRQGKKRPDLKQLRAGINAKEAFTRIVRSEYFPQVFLGAQFKYSFAPNRDNHKNPFLRDEFNLLQGGAVIGFRQTLSFGQTAVKVRKARLEHQKLLFMEHLASKAVGLEVEKVYRTLKEAEANLAAAERAVKSTRRWFITARDGFNAGIEEAGELIDAVKEYGIIRTKYALSVFSFNKAWAKLQKVTGNSILKS